MYQKRKTWLELLLGQLVLVCCRYPYANLKRATFKLLASPSTVFPEKDYDDVPKNFNAVKLVKLVVHYAVKALRRLDPSLRIPFM